MNNCTYSHCCMKCFFSVFSGGGGIVELNSTRNKTVGPTNVLTFLGLEIDTVLMLARIPALKLDKLKRSLQDLLTWKKETIRTLESVIGLMAFCARAIPSARAFFRRFYDLLSSVTVRKPLYKIRITEESQI